MGTAVPVTILINVFIANPLFRSKLPWTGQIVTDDDHYLQAGHFSIGGRTSDSPFAARRSRFFRTGS
jgi:hypothetical protein